MLTGKLLGTFVEHTKTVTNFITTENNDLYSVSLDGYLKKFNLKVSVLGQFIFVQGRTTECPHMKQ